MRRLGAGLLFCQAVRGWASAGVGATMTEVAVCFTVAPLRALRVYCTPTRAIRFTDGAV